MGKWEKHISLTIEDYQGRKRQFYREKQEILKHSLELRSTLDELDFLLCLHEAEKPVKERIFGQELGSRLEYAYRYFPFEEPEREEERFWLVPEDISQGIEAHASAIIDQWLEACPEEVERVHQLYWPGLWKSEDEIMRRFDYAIFHNWGMLMYYRSGK